MQANFYEKTPGTQKILDPLNPPYTFSISAPRPRVLGLTATVVNSKAKLVKIEDMIKNMEILMCSRLETASATANVNHWIFLSHSTRNFSLPNTDQSPPSWLSATRNVQLCSTIVWKFWLVWKIYGAYRNLIKIFHRLQKTKFSERGRGTSSKLQIYPTRWRGFIQLHQGYGE